MKTYKNLWNELCSYENLELAYKKARKHKTKKYYVIEFEEDLENNLLLLRLELLFHSYRPKSLVNFIIRDPKTRKISKSDFRDRVIHHALCNTIEPIYNKIFIYDSYANRLEKGNLKAVQRFDYFKRKVSKNNTKACYIFKADIKKYFETVNHKVLLNILKKKIKDNKIIWLIKQILNNCVGEKNESNQKGMPLGNLTSQFFANVYLNELDYFIKHKLKIKYYLRYVDDFIILHSSKEQLAKWKEEINYFLKNELKIELHPDKSRIIPLFRGIDFVGFKNFYYFRLLRKRNIKNMILKINYYKDEKITYDKILEIFQGWQAYAKWANTYKLRTRVENYLKIKRPRRDLNPQPTD